MLALLQNLIFGIQLGALYALIAIGYTMVYGVLRLINFAHGDVYMVGAYVGLTLVNRMGVGFASTLPGFATLFVLTMIICGLLGVTIERFAYRPLRTAPRLTALITAIGVSLLLETVAQMIWGAQPSFYPTLLSAAPIRFLGLELNINRLIILIASVLLMAVLWYVVTRTRVGKAMRATSYDREAAALMGINTNAVIAVTFALGSALAGAAGVLLCALTNIQIIPQAGILPGLKAFVAAVLGGIGNIPGAVLGGLVMGVAETLVAASHYSVWKDAVAFVLLILILLFRPAGMLGRAAVEKV